MLDRAGAVPCDGETHQGIFDIALMRSIPNLTILSPASESELKTMLNAAVKMKGAIVIRYPKLSVSKELKAFKAPLKNAKGILIPYEQIDKELSEKSSLKKSSKSTLIISTGSLINESIEAAKKLMNKNIHADVYNLRFIKPICEDDLVSLCKKYKKIVIAEDGIKQGGVGEYIECLLLKNGIKNIKVLGFPQSYLSQGTREEVLSAAGLSCQDIFNAGI